MTDDLRQLLEAALEHHRAARLADAIALYIKALEFDPNNADALHLLGIATVQSGNAGRGEALIRLALNTNPNAPAFYNSLGRAIAVQERWQEAAANYKRAAELAPTFGEAWRRLGDALHETDDLPGAEASYRQALVVAPQDVHAIIGLCRLLDRAGRFSEEAAYLRQALQQAPHWREAAVNLSAINLGRVLGQLGETSEAVAIFRKLLADNPGDTAVRDHLIFFLLASPSASNGDIAAEVGAYARSYGGPSPNDSFSNPREANRRLRIGYLSGGLRHNHNLLYILEPLLGAHDRAQAEIFLYGDVSYDASEQEPLRALVDKCCDTTRLDDAALADRIRRDGIDILVSLLGRGSRAPRHTVLFRRPAPIQMAYFWVGSTGIPTVDYWIADEATVPTNTDETFHETVVRLPHMFIFRPPPDAPPVSLLPAARNGHITFGSFANTFKLNDELFAAWAEILTRVAGSRLILKSEPFSEATTRSLLEARLRRAGMPTDRIAVLPPNPTLTEHLAQYGAIDIALDTFPYTFGNTAFEALWMGVPVVSLAGSRFANRITLSILTTAGFPDLVAADLEGYVRHAIELAADLDALARWRRTAREKISFSPLVDYAGHVRALEQTYRTAWRYWCESSS